MTSYNWKSCCKLAHINEYLVRRRTLAKYYDEQLKNTDLVLPITALGNQHAFYLFVCHHPKRGIIISELQKRNIFVNISYPWPIHTMSGYTFLSYKEGGLPQTEAVCREIYSLLMYPTITEEELECVSSALRDILGYIKRNKTKC